MALRVDGYIHDDDGMAGRTALDEDVAGLQAGIGNRSEFPAEGKGPGISEDNIQVTAKSCIRGIGHSSFVPFGPVVVYTDPVAFGPFAVIGPEAVGEIKMDIGITFAGIQVFRSQTNDGIGTLLEIPGPDIGFQYGYVNRIPFRLPVVIYYFRTVLFQWEMP